MGIVYHAIDETLNRSVAIKVLPESVATNGQRLARFQREAKLLASLNHPNIASIYEFNNDQDQPFVVMEFVDGKTLQDLISAGPLPWEDILPLAIQITEAMAYAHQHGVIHRDLKPANVKLTQEGTVKVLDFGLAKAVSEAEATSQEDEHVTQPSKENDETQSLVDELKSGSSMGVSSPGAMMGTIGYLSPEQARGREVDKQSDIFSFGALIFELLISTSPFASDSALDTIGKTLHKEPDWDELPEDLPPRLLTVLRRCLAKDKKDRLCDIGDARLELIDIKENPEASRSLPPAPQNTSRLGLKIVATLSTLAAIVFAALFVQGTDSTTTEPFRGVTNRAITVPKDYSIYTADSLDNERAMILVCAEEPDEKPETGPTRRPLKMLIRDRATDELKVVHEFGQPAGYAISPDQKSYVLNYNGNIFKSTFDSTIDPGLLCTVEGAVRFFPDNGLFPAERGIIWLNSGDIVVRAGTEETSFELVRIDSLTGKEKSRVPLNLHGKNLQVRGLIRQLDEEHIVTYAVIYSETGFSVNLASVSLTTGKVELLVERAGDMHVIGDDLFFTRGSSLLRAKFDPVNRTLLEAGEPVYQGLSSEYSVHGQFEITDNGTLIVLPGGVKAAERTFSLSNPEGVFDLELPPDPYDSSFDVSLDGKRICTTRTRPDGLWEIWGGTIDPPRMRKIIASNDSDYSFPLMSHDGSYILANGETSNSSGNANPLVLCPFEHSGAPEVFIDVPYPGNMMGTDFHPDGTRILFNMPPLENAKGPQIIGELDIATNEFKTFLSSTTECWNGLWSPDGKLVAYINRDRGAPELYVFNPDTGESTLVSDKFVGAHSWKKESDGSFSLLFWSSATQSYKASVDVDEHGTCSIGEAQLQVQNTPEDSLAYAIDHNGNVYSMNRGDGDAQPQHVITIEHWLSSLNDSSAQ